MATDKSEPRTPLILVMTVLVVSILVALKFLFDWYFLDVTEQHVEELVLANPTSIQTRDELRAQWEADLARDPMPITKAMEQIGRRGRASAALIAPQPSSDMGAQQGWQHARKNQGQIRGIQFVAVPPPPPPPAPEPVLQMLPEGVAPPPAPEPAPPPAPAPAPVRRIVPAPAPGGAAPP